MLCISGFMDDVTFGRNGRYGVAIGRSLMPMNACFYLRSPSTRRHIVGQVMFVI